MGNTPEEQKARMIASLSEKTGKDLKDWSESLSGLRDLPHMQLVRHLKSEFQVTHGFANLIAHEVRAEPSSRFVNSCQSSAPHFESHLDTLIMNKSSALGPVADQILIFVQSLGSDISIAPKKAYLSFRRKKQFGLLQPSTRDRIDLGLILKNVDPGCRIVVSGSFNKMVSHRIRIENGSDFGSDAKRAIELAYSQAG